MSSSTESDESIAKSRKYRKQKFTNKLLGNERFKGWLQALAGESFKCKCAACNKILNCGKSDLLKHSETKAHQKNVKAISKTSKLNTFFKRNVNAEGDIDKKKFEIRLSMFFAEHNDALTVVDHLIPLLKEIVPDSEIIKNVDLGRKKCTSIIKTVVAKEEKDNLVNKLKANPFSVMIDESTDIGLNKHMCILARFYDEEKGRVVVKLLDLLPIGADCTADALYKTFKELMLSLGIPFNDIIGMCSDGVNVMVGKCNSFASRLNNYIPNVVVVKCICHSAAIIASKACLALPRAPEDLLRQIGSYVSGSSKRCAQLEAVQEMLGGRKKKILRMCATRWLSHHWCVESVLENCDVLLEFFKQAGAQDKL
ncbi:protein FAM200C-like [Zeugodacus cucurbitae]|uniref:protein FAM200C-like n=1 Tax=Zeugodacus cucurbitae TaxID=28588 RepID=UPI0023D8E994|nr:protein FAM200C-like [Zeugodacus cucurbitae]XP_054083618.1 protein FAM200C-like [Zeugodacus cucurbitae]